VVLSGAFLDACLAGDRLRAQRLVEFSFPEEFPGDDPWVGKRREQVLADPAWEPWFLRALVLRDEKRMVEPSNAPSIRVIEKIGFTRLDLIIDGEAIFELRVR
jgi:hypothetical protein